MTHEDLLADGWECTDPSTNQWRKEIEEDSVYLFREDRIVNPETGETETFEMKMRYDDYDWWDITGACEVFGYKAAEVSKWMDEGVHIPLMLECLFELETDLSTCILTKP